MSVCVRMSYPWDGSAVVAISRQSPTIKQTSAAVVLCLYLVHRHPRNEKKGICSFFCFLLRKCVHSSGKLPLCGVIKGTDSSPKLATTPPVECVCSALRHILTSALFYHPPITYKVLQSTGESRKLLLSTEPGESTTEGWTHWFLENYTGFWIISRTRLLYWSLG